MAANVVHIRIDGKLKSKAVKSLASMGLTVSDAVRLLLTRVVAENALPFEVRVPNATTRKAMAELEAGKGKRVTSVEALMADLNAKD
jgi:DNA-damage-inducible protein J